MIKLTSAVMAMTAVACVAAPAEACNGCNRWFGGPTTAAYAPVVANYAPVGQVVNYVPQTNYRTVYMPTAVVAYSPVAACGPCGATTVLRPITTIVTQPRLVPYTTFRPVMAAPVMPACNACAAAPVAAAAYYAPAVPAVPVVQAAPALAPSMVPGQPMISAPMPAGAPGTVVRGLTPTPDYAPAPSSTVAPSLRPIPRTVPDNAPSNKTFDNPSSPSDESSPPRPESRLLIPPRTETNSNTSGPARALDPEGEDRMTSLPLRQASAMRPVSFNVPALDNSGWRSAGR